MATVLWSDILTEIQAEYDLEDATATEGFMTTTELMAIANEAIEDIEKEIHAIEDCSHRYFHSEAYLALESGTEVVVLPTDIYANKITGIYYDNGSNKYEIKPMRNLEHAMYQTNNSTYTYRLYSPTGAGPYVKFYPTPQEDAALVVKIYYLRKAALFSALSSPLDIPEAKQFIKQYVIDRAVSKERMTPDAPESPALARKRKALLDSLENIIEDNNNEVIASYDHYEESV